MWFEIQTLFIFSMLGFSSAFVFSYIYLKDITTMYFCFHLKKSLNLAKSLIQERQLLSNLLRKKQYIIETSVVDPIQVSLGFLNPHKSVVYKHVQEKERLF